MVDTIAFIGGGNMASAIIGGLLKQGALSQPLVDAEAVLVVEPGPATRLQLEERFGVRTLGFADASLAEASVVVWAVKPQFFAEAAEPCAPHVAQALHLSVMAGIRSDALVRATGSERIVRAMPNTPALIGQGIAGLYARDAVTPTQRDRIDALLAPTGRRLWLDREADLDAVTALSGSGPAYVFYIAEAMVDAAVAMGLTAEQGRELALATLAGGAALAASSDEPLADLRGRVTSKGGTTAAALASLEASDVKGAFVKALLVAQRRAQELGAASG